MASVRPLRRVIAGTWQSRDGRWTLMQDEATRRWLAYHEDLVYPLNSDGHPTLNAAVRAIERAHRAGVEARMNDLGWELRGAMAGLRVVRLTLSKRCDGVLPNIDGDRILEGVVTSVSPTNAFVVICDRHVPLGEVLAVTKVHFSQSPASDPRDLLEDAAAVTATLPP